MWQRQTDAPLNNEFAYIDAFWYPEKKKPYDGIIVNWLMLMALVQIKQNSFIELGASCVFGRARKFKYLSVCVCVCCLVFGQPITRITHRFTNEPKNREIDCLPLGETLMKVMASGKKVERKHMKNHQVLLWFVLVHLF